MPISKEKLIIISPAGLKSPVNKKGITPKVTLGISLWGTFFFGLYFLG